MVVYIAVASRIVTPKSKWDGIRIVKIKENIIAAFHGHNITDSVCVDIDSCSQWR